MQTRGPAVSSKVQYVRCTLQLKSLQPPDCLRMACTDLCLRQVLVELDAPDLGTQASSDGGDIQEGRSGRRLFVE